MVDGFAFNHFNIGFTLTACNLVVALGWVGFTVRWSWKDLENTEIDPV